MNWNDIAERMNNSVIKVDVTATDKEYFLATHVPFKNLLITPGGHDADDVSKSLTEEQIFDKFIKYRNNKHQLIIVRGDHGTGKSNLICWLHSKMISSDYDSSKEKIVFLRRLGNTTRGAVQQLISEGVVQDPELLERFQKFISSTETQNEDEFKLSIYDSYVNKISSDKSSEFFKPAKRREITSFLHDIRVQEYFLRNDGPIAKCYKRITAKAAEATMDNFGGQGAIFTSEDFCFPDKVADKIINEGAEEVRGFYRDDLKDNDKYIQKLVDYLNSFTSSVLQNCANITSENARDLFVNLRRNLKKEGKSLTLFIEDFTSFSMMEGELIVALAPEASGEYQDLCSVNSFIGITRAYYDDTRFFHDNLKDRVTWQITVTEKAYNSEEFLTELAGKYLNAAYCEPQKIHDWYQSGAHMEDYPVSDFVPNYSWESIEIESHKLTLYPFNRKSIASLFNRLQNKSPRQFLIQVMKGLFLNFATDMEYKSEWTFPNPSPFIAPCSLNNVYASSLDNSNLTHEDKRRLRVLLTTWGDSTTSNNGASIGGVPIDFIKEIGLSSFEGIKETVVNPIPVEPIPASFPIPPEPSREDIDYQRRLDDINNWYNNNGILAYPQDYNSYLTEFVLSAIPWQDEGIPPYYIEERQRTGAGYLIHIERSSFKSSPGKAVIVLDCNSESRDVLTALLNLNHYKSWDFENAEYYQLALSNWLAKNKNPMKARITRGCLGNGEHPIFNWCMATEYLLALLVDADLGNYDFFDTTRILVKEFDINKTLTSKPTDITDIRSKTLDYISNHSIEYQKIHDWLFKGCNTNMTVLTKSTRASETPAFFCRISELVKAYEYLEKEKWNILNKLPPENDDIKLFGFADSIKRIKDLYSRAEAIAKEEHQQAHDLQTELEKILGEKPTKANLEELCKNVSDMYRACNRGNIPYSTDLKIVFDKSKEFIAMVIGVYNSLSQIDKLSDTIPLLKALRKNPLKDARKAIANLRELETFANDCLAKSSMNKNNDIEINNELVENAKTRLLKTRSKIKSLEVSIC